MLLFFSVSDFSVESATPLVTSVYHSAIQALNPGDMQVMIKFMKLKNTIYSIETFYVLKIEPQSPLFRKVGYHGNL